MPVCVVFVCADLCGSGSENKSVVLASTAIQLLDERKSPIAAGKWDLKCFLSHTRTSTLTEAAIFSSTLCYAMQTLFSWCTVVSPDFFPSF